MPLITTQQVKKYKKSDIVIVYGSGYSINGLQEKDFQILSEFDSIGFNFFCFSKIPTTYYLIREQANLPNRVHSPLETVANFVSYMNKTPYINSCLILHQTRHHSPQVYDYAEHCGYFKGDYFITKDTKLDNHNTGINQWTKIDSGLIHGWCTLNNILHFIIWMGYKKILFVGVDLYDSRYFWLGEKETRYSVKNKKKRYDSKHSITNKILSLIKEVKFIYPDVQMYTYNPKSLLNKVISIWER